nr:ParB N-terminal domain-containing protein [Marvinbryantia formatexigens]
MEWRTIPVGDLHPAAYNPRKKLKPGDKEYEKIKKSIQEFGYVEPIIVNFDMTVIGGHQRLTVLKDLGYTEVQCVVVHIEDEAKVKALNIALNKITGAWNEQLLADLIVDLQSQDFNTDLTGFEPAEIDQLFSKVHNKEIKEDDFDVDEELKKPTMSKTEDLWLLGRHRLVCGDSLLPETFSTLMDGKRANLVVTDPPYNVNVEETAGKIKNDNMPDEDFYKFLFAAFVNMEQNMENDASIYVFHADSKGLIFRQAFHDAGFYLSGCCIWKKNALVLGRSPYQWQHEPCLFGWKVGGKHQWYSDRKQTTIWEYDRPNSSRDTSNTSDNFLAVKRSGYRAPHSQRDTACLVT